MAPLSDNSDGRTDATASDSWGFGVDSLSPITQLIGGASLARLAVNDLGGQPPLFWGRYVSTPGHSSYQSEVEAATFRQLGIHVLPIARQTGNVGGDAKQGSLDARNNIAALKESFGTQVLRARTERLYVFLDVEQKPSLSKEYYAAWAGEISNADIRLAPCLYMPNFRYWPQSWSSLVAAVEEGAPCDGLWIAWYVKQPGSPFMRPSAWDTSKTANPTSIPVLAWQYLGNVHANALDYSLINPAIDITRDLLPYLILPS
jgi:hypothetical protein